MAEQVRTINTSSWQELVRAIMGIQGGNPIPTIDDLVPVVALQVDRPEWLFPAGERPYGQWIEREAVVGEFGIVQLFNPANSGVLGIVEYASIVSATISSEPPLAVPQAVEAVTAVIRGFARDRRIEGVGALTSTLVIHETNQAVFAGSGFGRFVNRTSQHFDFNADGHQYIILPPGTGIDFFNGTQNQFFDCSLAWREKPLHKGVRG